MKGFSWILLLLLLSCKLNAQLVTKIDCCAEVGNKALIIINDNNTTSAPVNPSPSNTATITNNFNFTLSASANTSAGVYNSTGVLVRTLWSGVHCDAGCYTAQWDGLLDDNATAAPFGTYAIKVLTNNVRYNWLGVIGNTESSFQDNEYTLTEGFYGLAATNDYIYLACGVAEKEIRHAKASLSNLGAMLPVVPGGTGMNVSNVCTDGINTYWAGSDDYQPGDPQTVRPYFIFATKNTDDSQVSFSSGTSFTSGTGKTYSSAIAMQRGVPAEINGISLSGNYLFVSRSAINQVQVVNKTTGAVIQTLTIQSPYKIACTNDSKIWIAKAASKTVLPAAYVAANRVTGTAFSSTPYSSNTAANTQDGNFTTAFGSADGNNGYVGIDMGTAKTITNIAIAPETGSAGRVNGMVIQGSNTSSSTGFVDIYTIATTPADNQYTVYSFPNSTAYRYIRAIRPGDFCSMAEFAVFDVNADPTPVAQFAVNTDGTLTATGVTVPAGKTVAIAVSPATGELAVADNDNSQVRFYNPSGVQTNVLGQQGGYAANGAAVTYDKFKFFDNRGLVGRAAITFQPDGSFWLFDAGNYRVLHFNADRTYKEQIAYVPSFRSCAVDHNKPTSIFADALEYQVDYSKVATDIQHSWTLKNNWQTNTDLDLYRQFESVTTLPNGHTYAKSESNGKLYDLRPAGAVWVGNVYGRVEEDGSLLTRDFPNRQKIVVYKQPLTGFDGNYMPKWGTSTVVATTPSIDPTSPVYYVNNTTGTSTNPNHYFFYNPNYGYNFGGPELGKLYHLGSIKTGGNTWEWQTSKRFSDYSGPYPTDGFFAATGGHSENCLANVQGSNIFWHVNDELGAWTEVSRTNHFDESGLFIGHFGNDNTYASYTGDKKFWAGNSFKTDVFTVGNRMFYICCDESKHGGVHLTEVSNLSSINKQSMPVTVSKAVTTTQAPSDLMANVPYRSDFYGGQGWTVFPAQGDPVGTAYPSWQVRTSVSTYLKDDVDIGFYVDGAPSTMDNSHYLTRGLGTNNTNNWDLTANVLVSSDKNRVYFEVLDDQGKILAQLRFNFLNITINGISVATGNDYASFIYMYTNFKNIELKNTGGIVTFQYGPFPAVTLSSPFEGGANFSKPAKFRIRTFGSGAGNGSGAIKGLRFKVI